MPPHLDKLFIRGLRLYGRHGVHGAEKSLGQQFRVDIELHADLRRACVSDDFTETVDYVKVFELARTTVQGDPRNLVEKVAADIATSVLSHVPAVQRVKVRVMKPCVALPAVVDGVGVEIERDRK